MQETLEKMPKSYTKNGQIGNYFPQSKINKLLKFNDEMSQLGADNQPQPKSDYKELLMTLIKNK